MDNKSTTVAVKLLMVCSRTVSQMSVVRLQKTIGVSLTMAIAGATFAQTDTELCRIVENIKEGSPLIYETKAEWRIASKRAIGEAVQAGFSSVKGTLAQHISKGQPGLAVRWSRAEERGPVRCGSYTAILVAVDASTVSISTASPSSSDSGSVELEDLILRRLAGKASRDDLLRLREYYIQAGDMNQAKLLLDQITQTFN